MPQHNNPVPQGRIRRTMPLAGFTARAAGGRLVAGIRAKAGDDGAVDRFHERTAERYAELLGHSRGALMKAGQILSLIDARSLGNGGFAPYQSALARLQADAPPMHITLVRQVLDTELGPAVTQFADFTEAALAAASIGQVHRAVLSDGREVAVKIQYPGVAQAIRDDLANTELLTTFIRFAMSASGMTPDVRTMAREAAARICEEVDYRHEAASITKFTELYRGHPFIRVPEVIPELSSDRVLTMTYLDGMDWAAAQHADQDLKNTWAEVVLRFSYGNMRHANLLHADPHPGNYRFNTDGSVGFVDFGCVKTLPELPRLRWVRMVRAVIEGRFDDAREHMVQAGFFATDSTVTVGELRQWWSEQLHEITDMTQPATYTQDTIERALRGIFDLRSDANPLSRMATPTEFVFAPRAQLAISSILGALRATLPARAIADDTDGLADPITELGKLHHAWVRERGLPSALERHDHP
ncbi:ABC1 kinase family protein [Mycolicibacterium sphagni]|nr:AarF/ABC1/UbiB kinase family protein [Mycolicibacterium sphagni]MCV7177010.1 AarF/ABC1/UbiB kinase family protein [Mycolicibacterium sphagni]